MTRFFDSSAIVAAYAKQPESPKVRRLLARRGTAVCRLAEVETVSALSRLARADAISADQRDSAIASFLADLETWEVVEVTPHVTAFARGLLLAHPLRSADAIQLASALVLQSRIGKALDVFATFDARLRAAARAERLDVDLG